MPACCICGVTKSKSKFSSSLRRKTNKTCKLCNRRKHKYTTNKQSSQSLWTQCAQTPANISQIIKLDDHSFLMLSTSNVFPIVSLKEISIGLFLNSK